MCTQATAREPPGPTNQSQLAWEWPGASPPGHTPCLRPSSQWGPGPTRLGWDGEGREERRQVPVPGWTMCPSHFAAHDSGVSAKSVLVSLSVSLGPCVSSSSSPRWVPLSVSDVSWAGRWQPCPLRCSLAPSRSRGTAPASPAPPPRNLRSLRAASALSLWLKTGARRPQEQAGPLHARRLGRDARLQHRSETRQHRKTRTPCLRPRCPGHPEGTEQRPKLRSRSSGTSHPSCSPQVPRSAELIGAGGLSREGGCKTPRREIRCRGWRW